MKKILFAASISTHFNSLLPVAKALSEFGGFQVSFLLDNTVHDLKTQERLCFENNIDFISINKQLLDLPIFGDFVQFLFIHRKAILSHLLLNQPALVVLAEDTNYLSPIIVWAAHKLNIRAIVFPFSLSNQSEVLLTISEKGSVKRWFPAIISRFFPKWVKEYNGKLVVRATLSRIIALEMSNMAPHDPWIYIGGNADYIFVDSQFDYDYYIRAGIKHDKLIITGNIQHDYIPESLKSKNIILNDIYSKMDIQIGKPLLLWAFPPIILNSELPGYENGYKLVDKICSTLDKYASNFNIILNLHPRITKDVRSYLVQKELNISTTDLYRLIPLASVYLATVSATIRVAIGCEVPTINYDVFGFNYSDYDGIKGVNTIFSHEEFEEAVYSICQNEEYEFLSKDLKHYNDYYMKKDGKSYDRIVQNISKIVS